MLVLIPHNVTQDFVVLQLAPSHGYTIHIDCSYTGGYHAMWANDTGETEAVHVEGLTVRDSQDIGGALRAVRGVDGGNGEICIPIVNGLFNEIRIAITKYRAQRWQKKHRTA